jgi:hypothetical protein
MVHAGEIIAATVGLAVTHILMCLTACNYSGGPETSGLELFRKLFKKFTTFPVLIMGIFTLIFYIAFVYVRSYGNDSPNLLIISIILYFIYGATSMIESAKALDKYLYDKR